MAAHEEQRVEGERAAGVEPGEDGSPSAPVRQHPERDRDEASRPTTGMSAPNRNRLNDTTSEKETRSIPRSATTGFRNGPTVKRMPVERNTIKEKASATHHP